MYVIKVQYMKLLCKYNLYLMNEVINWYDNI